MPYPMSVAHRKCKFNFENKFKLCRFLYNLCNTYIHTDMLATCRIPCPLRTVSECYMYTYLDYEDGFIQPVDARTGEKIQHHDIHRFNSPVGF